MKRILSLFLVCICLLLSLTSCDSLKEMLYIDGFPEGFTNEYCMRNYEITDPNLQFLYCEPGTVENGVYESGSGNACFRAIKDVPYYQFMVVTCSLQDSPITYRRVVNHISYEINPIEDWTISEIELYWNHFQGDYINLGADEYYEHIKDVSNLETEILEAINGNWDSPTYKQEFDVLDKTETPTGGNRYILSIRVHFKQYENIVWDSQIYIDNNGEYYFSKYESGRTGLLAFGSEGNRKVAKIPDELAEVIENYLN